MFLSEVGQITFWALAGYSFRPKLLASEQEGDFSYCEIYRLNMYTFPLRSHKKPWIDQKQRRWRRKLEQIINHTHSVRKRAYPTAQRGSILNTWSFFLSHSGTPKFHDKTYKLWVGEKSWVKLICKLQIELSKTWPEIGKEPKNQLFLDSKQLIKNCFWNQRFESLIRKVSW